MWFSTLSVLYEKEVQGARNRSKKTAIGGAGK
jgi:hypothetical protein